MQKSRKRALPLDQLEHKVVTSLEHGNPDASLTIQIGNGLSSSEDQLDTKKLRISKKSPWFGWD
ncbi:MAG TPA: hypothetical protein VKM55_21400 [Candidatus Lokiarchaeia archaeon]|nr:hypothetical protein [Candidatus Lokiarchaeia archaeon]